MKFYVRTLCRSRYSRVAWIFRHADDEPSIEFIRVTPPNFHRR